MTSDRTSDVPLGELVELQRGTTYKSALLDRPGPVLLGLASIQPDGGFRRDSLRTYGGESPEKLLLRPGDVYVSLKDVTQSGDLLGAVARVPQEVALGRLTQDTVRLVFRSEETLRSYIYWILRTPQYRDYCRSRAIGTTTLALPREDFLSFQAPEATPARLRVLWALEALDDKIECCRRIVGRLEELLWASFDEEFVQSPDQDVASVSLATIARFVNGRAFTKDANVRGRPILRIRELNSGIDSSTPLSDIEAQEDNIARHPDLLFAWSGSLDVYRWNGPESLINQHIFKVIPHDGYPTWFVEGWIRNHLPEFQAIASGKATTMGHIQRHHLDEAEVVLPHPDELKAARTLLDPLDGLRSRLALEIRHLAAIRDALLPKLVSGEIRVPGSYEPPEKAAA